MTKEEFLTVRWNNLLSWGLGIPGLMYALFAFPTSGWLGRGGLIGLAIIGVLYWIVIEYHTSMRFAWLRENLANFDSIKQGYAHPLALIRLAYNLVFWIFLIPFLYSTIDYGTGFIAFTVVIFIRLTLNLYTNNFLNLTPAQFESYPFRIPWINGSDFIGDELRSLRKRKSKM